MKQALPAILRFLTTISSVCKNIDEMGKMYQQHGRLLLAPLAHLYISAETHRHKLNAGNQEFEANTDLQSQVHLLIRL